MLFDDREERCLNDWLIKAKEHSKSIEPKKYNPQSGIREPFKIKTYQKIISEHQELIASKKDIIERVKGHRDKALAHSDASYFNEPDDLYVKYPLNLEEIEDLITTASEILRTQHVYLFESDLDIQVHTTSNIDTILWHIRGFKRVWQDKRAESLHPNLYKLDDYEEKLKEHLGNKNKK
jgi:AbiU2